MKRYWIFKGIKFLAFGVLAVAGFGYVVMSLWNWVIPAVTGWHAVTFAQALGLLVLSRLLFGGLRGHRGGWHWRHRMQNRWAQMSPAERERLRDTLGRRRHCGSRPADGPTSTEAG